MAFKLFKKPLPEEQDKKNPKFKDVPKVKDELTEEELEHIVGNYNELEFDEIKRAGRKLKEEEAEIFKK